MIPEIGHFSAILALFLALIQAIFPIVGAYQNNPRFMALARPVATGQFVFVTLAFLCLMAAFVGNDFSVRYVAENSNSALPIYYRVTGVWGGHEGSLLLWIEILAVWTLMVTLFSRTLPRDTLARVLGVMGWISVGFLAFLLFASNPFERLLPAAIDGRDLNPLLQDFGMIIHPPMLYMGYVGFSVAFAFAIAALMSGQLDTAWARWSRPWTLVAWSFLTLGIFLGSFWAYYVLGWGGWWFWDAVENASFMPWLVGTALVHSLIVTEKRGSFKNWTVLLAIMAFSLSLLGTFLVRSGVLTSVHAFATDPKRGLFILVFLTLVIGVSLTLFAWRAPKVGLGGQFRVFSRETMLLLNNVLLVVAAATVFLGTLYPLFLDAFNLGKISVGPPYFEAVFVPLMVPLLVLLAIGPFVRWKSAQASDVVVALRWVALLTFIVVCALKWVYQLPLSWMMTLGLTLAIWILFATTTHTVYQLRHAVSGVEVWKKIRVWPLSYWGMLVAHAGIAVFVIGVTLVKGWEVERDVRMQVGDVATLDQYTFELVALRAVQGPNYKATRGVFDVFKNGVKIVTLNPEKRIFTTQNMPMTEAAIDRSFTRDLYLALGEPIDAQTWIVRLQHKPFVAWIWLGCLLIAGGGLLAALDRRYRAHKK